jgi:hypothetical protein
MTGALRAVLAALRAILAARPTLATQTISDPVATSSLSDTAARPAADHPTTKSDAGCYDPVQAATDRILAGWWH